MIFSKELGSAEKPLSAGRVRSTIGAGLLMLAFAGALTGIGILIPSGTERFQVPVSAYLVQYSILGIVGALMMPTIGRVVQRFGLRKSVIVASLWSFFWIVALSFTTELWQFYLCTLLWSLLWSFTTVIPATLIVRGWHNHNRLGLVMGFAMSGGAIGSVLAGVLMPRVVAALGWSGAVRGVAAMVLVCMTLSAVVLIRNPPKPLPTVTATTSTTGVSGSRVPFLLLLLGAGLISLEAGLGQVLAPIMLTKGFDLAAAGLLLSYFALIQIVLKPLGGFLYDKGGVKLSAVVLIVSYVIGFGALTFVTDLTGLLIVLPFASMALTNHLVLLPMFVSSSVAPERFASRYGSVMMVYYLGASVAAPLWGLGFDLTGTYTFSLLAALAAGVVASVILLAAAKVAKRDRARIEAGTQEQPVSVAN